MSDFKEYTGKFYKTNDGFVIGKIYKVTDVLKCRELFFDNDSLGIYYDWNTEREIEDIEIISWSEFDRILDNWFNNIKKFFKS